ncbi:MAG: HlyC/CorC family transporter [Chloroflexi bacterium]|nr:HlyC/CorC family transporter [Chloroflexota bacterium]
MSVEVSIPLSSLLPPLLQTGVAEGGLNLPWSLVLLVGSVIGYALVNTIEIGIVGASRIRIRHLAEEGSKSAQALERIREHDDRFFASIVLLQNLFVVVASTMAGLLAVDLAGGWGLLVGTVIVTAGIALFGEVTPKVLAARSADRIALILARPAELVTIVLRPVAVVFAAVPNFLAKTLLRDAGEDSPTVTEAELRMLIDIGAEEGAFGEEEAKLMERVFRFYDRRVNELMVPRTEVHGLETGTSVEEFYKAFNETPHARFPVFHESLDSVIGVVNIKDVLRAVAQGRASQDTLIDALVRPAYSVPETKLAGELLVEMQERRAHLALVVDEYGGTAGIITLEILLEEMVGPVVDELGRAEQEFQTIDEQTVRVDGGMGVHEAREELELPIPEGDYETVAGYVLSLLGHLPVVGESVEGDGLQITVAAVDERKIEQLVITRLPAGSAPTVEAS